MKILKSLSLVIVIAFVMANVKPAYALTDESTLNIYHCSTLHSNVWKQWLGKNTGNSCKWNYLVSAGSSRTYVYRRTKVKSWTNTKSDTSSYRSNVVVSPEKYYKDNTMAIHNKAKVKICGDKRVFEINAVA